MAFIHTIQVANEKKSGSTVSSTRKSENRRYLACIVATTTEASLAINAEKYEEIAGKLVDAKIQASNLSAKLGMTLEQATAHYEAAKKEWYDRDGSPDPHDMDGPYGLVRLHADMDLYKRHIARRQTLTIGSQAVVSWHGTVSLAQKALGSRECVWAQQRGDTLAIRTDIEITETKKRDAK